nr:hypothetical protein [Tanacetum cinerariifolium]GFA35071.1 hypothetical protein [Tanacetum cinerariifolium]
MSNPHQELASPDQTISGKDLLNPLMADNLPKIIWYSTHHVALMKSWLVQKQTALGVNRPRCDEDRLELMDLTVFFLPKVKKVRIEVSVVDLQVSAVRHMLLLHTTKYTSPALTQKVFANIRTQKVFANMRRVGKEFFEVETPLFEGMLVAQDVVAEGDAEVHGEEVIAGDAAEGDVSAAHGEVPTIVEEPSIPSTTPPTPP